MKILVHKSTTMTLKQHELYPHETFYVGGQYVKVADGDHLMSGQMFVRRYGESTRGRRPVILVHGAAQTGAHWECTSDGRPGLAQLLAKQGRAVYVVDQPGIGRSRYHEEEFGTLTHYSAEKLEKLFTAPAFHNSWPQARSHTQWPGTGRMGDPIFDAFYASQVGHLSSYSQVERQFRHAGAALLKRIGPAFLITHSQSGPLGWHLADELPKLVLGIVALEPRGPPFAPPELAFYASRNGDHCPITNGDDAHPPPPTPVISNLERPFGITSTPLTYDPPRSTTPSLVYEYYPAVPRPGLIPGWYQAEPPALLPQLAEIPVIVVTAEASYHVLFDHLTVSFLRQVGVKTDHAYLADYGIRGNGHLMGIELNNAEIADFIHKWVDDQDTVKNAS